MINFSRRLHFLKAKERSTHIQDLQRRRRVGCICFFCDILHTKSRGIKKVVLMESFRSQPKSQVLQQQQQRGERKRRKILAWRIYYVLLLPSTKAVVLYLAPHVRAYSVPECVLRKPEKAVDRQQQQQSMCSH